VIDREQVLHVAKLARLELSDEEVGRMATELSSVLGHIETISKLELDDVAPTSHVVEVANALRADVEKPSLPRDVALAQPLRCTLPGAPAPHPAAWPSTENQFKKSETNRPAAPSAATRSPPRR
jgi:aspartyl-tRNA(Asn)/glutamyl-tRNA(Gln) amidotransferase subunit C